MSPLDKEVLAEKAAAVERHLARVQARLPARPNELEPSTDDADIIVLHLWQAVQIVIDLALAACVTSNLGLRRPTPRLSSEWRKLVIWKKTWLTASSLRRASETLSLTTMKTST